MWQVPYPLSFAVWDRGNQFMLLDPNVFFAPSFVVGSFRYPYPSLCCLILINLFSCHLKMARKVRCPDTPKGMKKPGDRGGSTHRDMNIGLFKAEVMQVCIDEINQVEGAARLNNEKPKKSRNQICEECRIERQYSIQAHDGKGPFYGTSPWWSLEGAKCSQQVGFKRHRPTCRCRP